MHTMLAPARPLPLRHNTRFPAAALSAVAAVLALSAAARGQFEPGVDVFNEAPGVVFKPDGHVHSREADPDKRLSSMRNRARLAEKAAKEEALCFVSLPKLFADVRAAREAGKPVPEELKYVGGMTQVRYVFVYPDENDLVIGGPSEPWVVEKQTGLYAYGRKSGRPVLQLEDLVAAMRTSARHARHAPGGGGTFGCGIDPSPDSLEKSKEVVERYAKSSRKERMAALAEALGPQTVRVFGTEPDTRLAWVCVAADYQLKRFSTGADRPLVDGVGHAVDDSRSAANKFWFVMSYEPLLVAEDGNAYEFRGQRLGVKAGGFNFDPRGATDKAKAYAERLTKHIPAYSQAVPLFAELQNVADVSLLAVLIRHDRLDRKVGWDTAWILDDTKLPIAKVPVPKTADTVVASHSGSLVAGGVVFRAAPLAGHDARRVDEKKALDAPKAQAQKLRQATTDSGAVLRAR
jgi:Protein of unknown function (DUF1598)